MYLGVQSEDTGRQTEKRKVQIFNYISQEGALSLSQDEILLKCLRFLGCV